MTSKPSGRPCVDRAYNSAAMNRSQQPLLKRHPDDGDKSAAAPPLEIELPEGDADDIGTLEYWLSEAEASSEVVRKKLHEWKNDLASYQGGKPKLLGMNDADIVNVNVAFYNAEGKKPDLFYRTPSVNVTGLEAETLTAGPMVQAILKQKLGRQEINASALMDDVLQDLTVIAGFSATMLCYDAVKVPTMVPTGAQEPKIVNGAPEIDPATGKAVMQPTMAPGQATVWSKYCWDRISPSDFRRPAGFLGSRFDLAPWLGYAFTLDAAMMRKFALDEDSGESLRDDMTLATGEDKRALQTAPRALYICYRASIYDPDEINPERIRELIIVPGVAQTKGRGAAGRVIVHRNSPNQTFDARGKLIQGATGFPIKVFTLRASPEQSFPQSDAAVLRDVASEKSMGRSLMVQQRRRALPMTAADKTRLDKDVIDQIEKGTVQKVVFTNGDPHDLLVPLDSGQWPADNYQFDRIAQQDIDRLSGSGPNQQALTNDSADTATEASIIDQAHATRIAKERERVLEIYLSGVEYLFALLQMFQDHAETVEIIGKDGAAQLERWNKDSIQGRFGFELKPDSSLRTNAAEERGTFLQLFNLAANSPAANPLEFFKALVMKFNEDPTKLVVEALPEKKDTQKLSVPFDMTWLNPAIPGYDARLDFLEANGYTIPAPMRNVPPVAPVQPATPETSGPGGGHEPLKAMTPIPPVSQHHADLTGNLPGPGPM